MSNCFVSTATTVPRLVSEICFYDWGLQTIPAVMLSSRKYLTMTICKFASFCMYIFACTGTIKKMVVKIDLYFKAFH